MFFILPLRDNAPRPALPLVTLTLIVLNLLCFLNEVTSLAGIDGVINAWGLEPARIWAGEVIPGTALPAWLTLLTANYLHFSWLHLLGNMLMLWLFGCSLEYLCGPWRFLAFYTACGLVSSFVTAVLGGNSVMAAAGASGAIAGVMAGFLLNYPRSRITCFVLIWFFYPIVAGLRNISAFWFIGGWIAQQLFYSVLAFNSAERGPFGVFAHAAGALGGMALIYVLRLPENVLPADHPLRRGSLSAPFIGDAGDAGGGRAPGLTAHEQRIRAMEAPFSDSAARAMLTQGDLLGARAYCEQMLDQSERDGNLQRIAGFERLLREIALLEQRG